jgi:hypothetical protein
MDDYRKVRETEIKIEMQEREKEVRKGWKTEESGRK